MMFIIFLSYYGCHILCRFYRLTVHLPFIVTQRKHVSGGDCLSVRSRRR